MNDSHRPIKAVMTVDQVLYGYSRGHRRLAGSAVLPPDGEELLLYLSDLSGPSGMDGFDTYLTGYPLPSASLYALSRTWYADEMERPGCVWTHTLLIPFADLARIRDLREFASHFVRPPKESSPDLAPYASPLHIRQLAVSRGIVIPDHVRSRVRQIVCGLYANATARTIVAEPDALRLEDAVLLTWSQQWPRLRRAFRFCTGSLAPRSILSDGFDLEVVPSARTFAFRDSHSIFVNEVCADRVPEWVEAITDDIVLRVPSRSRMYWAFGADITSSRTAMRPLTEVILGLHPAHEPSPELATVLAKVSVSFPLPAEAGRLKRALFGPALNRAEWNLRQDSENEVLRILATDRNSEAISAEVADIASRVEAFATHSPSEASALFVGLLGESLTSHGEAIVDGLFTTFSDAELARVLRQDHRLLTTLLRNRPKATLRPELWEGGPVSASALFDTAVRLPLGNEDRAVLVRTVLDAKVRGISPLSIRRLGAPAVRVVLDWVQSSTSKNHDLDHGWRDLLRTHSATVVAWLQDELALSSQTLALLPEVVEPEDFHHGSGGPEILLRVLDCALKSKGVPQLTKVRIAAFAFALGVELESKVGARLISLAFLPLHQAFAEQCNDSVVWRHLEERLPPAHWWQAWDTCERLRRAFADAFVKHDWPPEILRDALGSSDIRYRVLGYLDGSKKGKRYRKRLESPR